MTRIHLATLDPTSALAQRIRAALARKMPRAGPPLVTGRPTMDPAAPGSSAPKIAASGQRRESQSHRREEDLHRAIIDMIAAETAVGVITFHVPNGGKRGKTEAGRLKGMGTLAGIFVAGRAFGLEVKTDVGRLSGAQKAMAQRFRRAGSEYDIARSVSGARRILARWGALAHAEGQPS